MVHRDSDDTERRTGRRSVLKAGAVGLATVAASGTALAAGNRSDKASDVHAVKGTLNSPVREKQRKRIRRRAVAEYERNTGNTIDSIPAAKHAADSGGPDSSGEGKLTQSEEGDGEVVAFAYGIDADGVARSYTGLASKPGTADSAVSESETESRDRAEGLIHDRFEDRVRGLSRTLEATDDDVTTQSGGTINNLENMETAHEHKAEHAKSPYGVISSTYYWLQDTEQSDEGTLHGFHSPMTIEPGSVAFGSGWKNEKTWQRHYWDRNEMAWQEVGNGYWKPAGPSDGGSTSTSYKISVSVGWSGIDVTMGMSWSYTEPAIERIDESSQYNDYCSWQWDVTDRCGGSVRNSTLAMQPSSTCEMESYECSMGERDICHSEIEGRFTEHCDGGYHWLKSSTTHYKHC